jgi:hypothetical protein
MEQAWCEARGRPADEAGRATEEAILLRAGRTVGARGQAFATR